MASIKIKFRSSTVADHEGAIYYQIIHERKVRQLLSDYKVYQSNGMRSGLLSSRIIRENASRLSFRFASASDGTWSV